MEPAYYRNFYSSSFAQPLLETQRLKAMHARIKANELALYCTLASILTRTVFLLSKSKSLWFAIFYRCPRPRAGEVWTGLKRLCESILILYTNDNTNSLALYTLVWHSYLKAAVLCQVASRRSSYRNFHRKVP